MFSCSIESKPDEEIPSIVGGTWYLKYRSVNGIPIILNSCEDYKPKFTFSTPNSSTEYILQYLSGNNGACDYNPQYGTYSITNDILINTNGSIDNQREAHYKILQLERDWLTMKMFYVKTTINGVIVETNIPLNEQIQEAYSRVTCWFCG